MKVVLFCGGLGTRLREYSETIPKPMVEIGGRPIIWHLMRYYAHFGHTEFVLCLGYRGDVIKKYFMYKAGPTENVVSSNCCMVLRLTTPDMHGWIVNLVDTGENSNIGQRLLAVRDYIGDDEVFMANYSDGLTDLDLDLYVEHFFRQKRIASFLCVKPSQSFHVVDVDCDGQVRQLQPVGKSDLWINGGYFIFKRDIFDYICHGEELVQEPFYKLIAKGELVAYRNPGFWACMDTLKEKKMFDEMYACGDTPWAVWEASSNGAHERPQLEKGSSTSPAVPEHSRST